MTTDPESTSSFASRVKFAGALILGLGLLALVLVVMGTRLDNQDVTPPPASAAEGERQNLAVRVERIGASDPALQETTQAWSEALGGLWVPWPQGAPEGYTNPPLEVSAVGSAELVSELNEFAAELTTAKTIPAPLATSMAAAAMIEADARSDEALCTAPDFTVLAGAVADGLSVVNLTTAEQILQAAAAPLTPGERDREMARIQELSGLISLALESGAPDTRPAMVTPVNADVDVAYGLIADQLIMAAANASPEQKSEIASYLCHLAAFPDAPPAEPLPGLDEGDFLKIEPSETM